MTTVSEFCLTLADAVYMPIAEVKKYARALINSGDLPRASGRAVPEIDFNDRARLILAIASADRPSGCVKVMRDHFDARELGDEVTTTAGKSLANTLENLANKDYDTHRIWAYSDLEVSRNGVPLVRFRLNQNLRRFENSDVTEYEFFGGPFLEANLNDRMALLQKYDVHGFHVLAVVSGEALAHAALGSRQAVSELHAEITQATANNGGSDIPELMWRNRPDEPTELASR